VIRRLLTESLKQFLFERAAIWIPWFPARVVCHDILGQTALVDLAGLARCPFAEKGGDPSQGPNPVVPTS